MLGRCSASESNKMDELTAPTNEVRCERALKEQSLRSLARLPARSELAARASVGGRAKDLASLHRRPSLAAVARPD